MTPFCGSIKTGDWNVVILDMHVPPCNQKFRDINPCHSVAGPEFSNIVPLYALLQSWTFFTPKLVSLQSLTSPCESRPYFYGCFHEITIVQTGLQLDLCFGCAMTCSYINRAAIPSSLEVNFEHSNLEAQTLGPKQNSCLCWGRTILPLTYHANEWGKYILKKILEGQELWGGSGSFTVTYTLLVVMSWLFSF